MRRVSLFFCSVALACSAGCREVAPYEVAPGKYVVDAKGQSAIIDGATSLTWPVNQFSGLILNAEVCDGRAYLFAPNVKSTQVAELSTGLVIGRIGRSGNGPGDLRRPVSIGVDCRNHKLYCVEGPGGVLAFDLNTGQYVTAYAHPAEFRASMGSGITMSTDGSHVYVPGLWPSDKEALDRRRRGAMYSDTNLGLDLSVGDRTTKPITAALETGCSTDLTACLRVDLQLSSANAPWVVAQGGGTRMGMFSVAGVLARSVDIRSPRFVRDGSVPGERTEDQVKWGETNSSVWGLYVFHDTIAVVHARHLTKN